MKMKNINFNNDHDSNTDDYEVKLTDLFTRISKLYLYDIDTLATKCMTIIKNYKINKEAKESDLPALEEYLLAFDYLVIIIKVLTARYLEDEALRFWRFCKEKNSDYLEARKIYNTIFFDIK